MVFITPFFKKPAKWSRRTRSWCGLLLVWFLMATGMSAAWAEPGTIKATQTAAAYGENQIELSGRFIVTLTPTLEDALANGLSLPFVYEFQLTRPRTYSWYRQLSDWFSPTATLTYRLSYHALSRQYRLHLGSFYRSFSSLDQALAALGVLRDWGVLQDTSLARDKDDLAGRMRLRLDMSQLPKTFQLTALGHSDWQLESQWTDFALHNEEEAH
ncbi:hypothetical protein WG78_21115 [Amantichitinum ursilacus]|uniref:DUF4390 domain-containing protein n=2 Tax=Amantichitinum ursilacus TaxID=857265 RepID=A0A0N0GL41_9NEIS|nr:hypothetical protein WG78_21115 [Amantichitinum ursilacus]